jgi:DNA-binding phage protein
MGASDGFDQTLLDALIQFAEYRVTIPSVGKESGCERTDAMNAKDYERIIVEIYRLLDVIKDDEGHPFAETLDLLGDLALAYEDNHFTDFPAAVGKRSDTKRADITTVYAMSQAKRRLTGLMKRVEQGEDILLERRDGYRIWLSPAAPVKEVEVVLKPNLSDVERSLNQHAGSIDAPEDEHNRETHDEVGAGEMPTTEIKHDDAMAEVFRKDPAYAVKLLSSLLEDGDRGELLIALRQLTKAFGDTGLNPNQFTYNALSSRDQERIADALLSPPEPTPALKRAFARREKKLRAAKDNYRVIWSAEDNEYVGLCDSYASLSWLAPTAEEALAGILRLVADINADRDG